jgi:lipopolysaccharide biosynthesis glycosyltransferase
VLVACAATEEFLAPVSAMLRSLLVATGSESVEVVLMHDETLSARGRLLVQETVDAGGGTLSFLAVPPRRLDEFPSGRFPSTIWARVLLPDLLPDADKVLYLDADTLVLQSPAPLWSTALGDSYLAAVANPLYSFMGDWPRTELGIEDPRRYINSGVLLMNLDLMRRDGCGERLLEYARRHPENSCPDQDALSVLLGRRHMPLHPKWNAQTTLWDLRIDELPFTRAEVHEARTGPAIVHFIGPFKPWHYLCTHPYRDRYFEYLAATPWPAPELQGRTTANRVLRHLSPVWVNRWFRGQQALERRRTARRQAAGSDRR